MFRTIARFLFVGIFAFAAIVGQGPNQSFADDRHVVSGTGSSAEKAVQLVQVNYQNKMTMNGQVVGPGMFGPGSMMKMMLGGMVQQQVGSLIGNALSHVLMAVNPIIGAIANQIVQRVTNNMTQKMMGAMGAPAMGIREVQGDTVTTTMSSARTRIDAGALTTIVQCDTKQMIVINNNNHTYAKQSFDDIIKDYTGQLPSQISWHIDESSDGQKEIIAGIEALHQTQTVTISGLEHMAKQGPDMPDMSHMASKMITEEWVSSTDIPDNCAMAHSGAGAMALMTQLSASPQPSAQQSPTPQTTSQPASPAPEHPTIQVPLRLLKHISIEGMPSMPPVPAGMPTMPDISQITGSRAETTSVKEIGYDASFFDVPAGYTEDPSLIQKPKLVQNQ